MKPCPSPVGMAWRKVLSLPVCRVLVVLREVVPELGADQADKEPAGVFGTDNPGMLGRGDKVQPVVFAWSKKPRVNCLTMKLQQSRSLREVLGNDVLESRLVTPRLRALSIPKS